MHRVILFITAAILGFGFPEVPASVVAERDLEKRSELALKAADDQISAAVKAYTGGTEPKVFEQHISTIEELARLSMQSLQDTGKQASKKPKYFKRAELKLRALLRRMATLSNDVSVDDRPRVEAAMKSMTEIHEKLLHDIMAKK